MESSDLLSKKYVTASNPLGVETDRQHYNTRRAATQYFTAQYINTTIEHMECTSTTIHTSS